MTTPTNPASAALVLQGGGALGAYQAGVYRALFEHDIAPAWLAGISIGAINSAIIAGNAPAERVARLRKFWDLVSSRITADPWFMGGAGRRLFNEMSAATVALAGVEGFFTPRTAELPFALTDEDAAISYYDTAPLRQTLLELVDFDRINAGDVRLSMGAVQVTTGNFRYFDNHLDTITPDHVMASGALPPGFPPIYIDGEAYWDGGIVSNTPLQYVLDNREQSDDMTIFQVDLFSARGRMPKTMGDVAQREKDIRFSSRTRLGTDSSRAALEMQHRAKRLYDKLPDALKQDVDARKLVEGHCDGAVTIMHLINRGEEYETQSKDYEFSRVTVNGHWDAGYGDTLHSLQDKHWTSHKAQPQQITVLDLGPAKS